jgi:hypothetical protein
MSKTNQSKKAKPKVEKAPSYQAPAVSLYDALKNAPTGSGSGMRAGFWKPLTAGEHVEGIVTRIQDGQFDQQVLTLRTDDGSLINVPARREGLLHRILFDELQVEVHGRLAVIYDGEKLSAAGRKYRTWRCAFRAADSQPQNPRQQVTEEQDDRIPY